MTSPASTRFFDIPELRSRVCEELNLARHRRSLASLSRVSRALHDAAQRALYHDLVLDTVDEADDFFTLLGPVQLWKIRGRGGPSIARMRSLTLPIQAGWPKYCFGSTLAAVLGNLPVVRFVVGTMLGAQDRALLLGHPPANANWTLMDLIDPYHVFVELDPFAPAPIEHLNPVVHGTSLLSSPIVNYHSAFECIRRIHIKEVSTFLTVDDCPCVDDVPAPEVVYDFGNVFSTDQAMQLNRPLIELGLLGPRRLIVPFTILTYSQDVADALAEQAHQLLLDGLVTHRALIRQTLFGYDPDAGWWVTDEDIVKTFVRYQVAVAVDETAKEWRVQRSQASPCWS